MEWNPSLWEVLLYSLLNNIHSLPSFVYSCTHTEEQRRDGLWSFIVTGRGTGPEVVISPHQPSCIKKDIHQYSEFPRHFYFNFQEVFIFLKYKFRLRTVNSTHFMNYLLTKVRHIFVGFQDIKPIDW